MENVLPFETHSFNKCEKLVIDLHERLEKSTRAFSTSSSSGNKEPWLFNWIMEDECISREAIHSLARRDLPIDDPNNKPAWDTRDLSLWVGKWLPESCPENTLNTALPALGNSLDQCRLWASTYQGTGNPLDIEFFHFFGLWDPATQTIVYRTRHGFQVFANPEDPAAESISNRPVGRHPGSNTNLKRVSSWLQNCQEHHNCEVIPGAIPARVIEVTGTPDAINMRLCSTDHLGPVPYACLSYCWGGEQERKCTASNIASYQTAIPFEEQPATIRDSARVYLGIGLRYLWIDALCIIQDDPNDKPVEIAKMPSIYGGANITIVAARSSSSTAGFLGERFPGRLEAARISYRCIDGQLGSVTLAKLGGGFESVEPIDERGWTLQERLLSLRIVEFGSRQTRWICPETRSSKSANEGLTDGWRRNADYNRKRKTEGLNLDVIRTAKTTIDFYGRPRASRFHEYLTAMDHWEKICATFTARALTLSSDRAMAIAGVAQIFADFSGDRYVAGLWKSCFHSGLLWSIDHSYTYPRNFARPLMYQGPSWSWLAVNGTVRFARVHGAADCVAEILSVETEPATATAPFGLVRPGSGRLVLCARAVLGVRKRVPLRSPGTFRDEVAIIGVKKPVLCFAIAKLHFDVQGEEMDEDEEEAGCLLVEIVRSSNLGSLSFQGLVLRWSSPERKTYSRIGVFSLSGRRKGTLCEEFLEEGGPSEEDFNCFPDKARVIEII